ncbi:S9 family peptidase [Pedomonas mirosovicensis]|uniref:S9 family peptidase n=1 Tax=Pedomonas mirosovicensis TaxID=2908641 RepID=UPI0021679FBE|nr:S9 family peptidase [Pedomonas mirosovicensis]MCH8686732.1 S9 family peptidase [Pedomonas mirosovicensis]
MLSVALAAPFGPAAASATADGSTLTLKAIYGPDAVKLDDSLVTKWFEAGKAYTAIEKSATVAGGVDLVRYETASGKRSVLVDASWLVPAGAKVPLQISDYDWSTDRAQVLLFVRAPGARRGNPAGDYWLFDLKTKALHRLGGDAAQYSLLYATFSPDGRRIAYVCGNNLFVETVADGSITQLTQDGGTLILNGRSDVAYEEEFSLGKAFEWSPDSRRIAYWRFDTSGVGTFYLINNTDGIYSKPIPQQYPKPGTTISAVQVGTVSVEGGATTWFAIPGDPRQRYIPRMSWADSSSEVLIQHLNRLQNRNEVLIGKATDGSVRQVFLDEDAAWVNVNDRPAWIKGRWFTWLSERDGWRHLYLVSRDGKKVELRTPGDFDVVSIENIDPEHGTVTYIASPTNVTQRYLYRASLTGAPKLERLTPAGQEGYHAYDIAPDGRWAFHTVSRFGSPPVTDIVSLPQHKSVRTIAGNAAMHSFVEGLAREKTEFFKVDIGGGTLLDAWMMKPPGFDPEKKYPLLVYVYSEPAGQTVADSWGGDRYLWHLMLSQQGYLVASVDSRGAAAPRGREWRKSIYRQVGIQASADQAAAVRAMLASRPYIDADRIGVWGWSGGGAMTLNAMFRYPDLYKTGIAVAAPANQRLYNAIYQERYMGLPEDNAKGYAEGSPINFAQNLKGNLLIIHGTGDDNVHYQNLEQLVDRLVASNRQFQMMAYPDRSHGISEKPGTRLHLFTLMTNYLHEHLPAGAQAR